MSWPVVALGDIADTALGKMLDRGKPKGLPEVEYLRNVNVQWDSIDTADLRTMELADDERERFAIKTGDLLVCEGGEIGRCAIWHGRSDYLAYQKALHRVRPSPDLDSRYLRYLLEHHAENGTLARLATGSTIAHLPQQRLRQVPVPLPSIETQRRIVDILEDHLSCLDAADSYLSAAAARADRLVNIALANCRDGELIPLPSVAEIQGGVQKQQKRLPRDNAYPFLRVANVTKSGLNLDDVHTIELFDGELERLRLQRGDLLVVEGNGSSSQIGRAAVWDGSIADSVHQNHLIRVRPRGDLDPDYLEAVWNAPQTRSVLSKVSSSSSGLHTLSVSKLKRLHIPVPSVERQRELVGAVDLARGQRSAVETAVNTAAVRSAALRRSLLTAAFSGNLTGAASDLSVAEEMIVR